MYNVVDKVVKNLICFTSANHKKTPRVDTAGTPNQQTVSHV